MATAKRATGGTSANAGSKPGFIEVPGGGEPLEDTPRLRALLKGMIVADVASEDPTRPAVISPKGNRTFGELNARCNQLARTLRQSGVGAGDSVAMCLSNRPEFVEVLYATSRIGARITPINWHLGSSEINYILRDCGAKAFIAEERFAETAAAGAAEAPGLLLKLLIDGHSDSPRVSSAATASRHPGGAIDSFEHAGGAIDSFEHAGGAIDSFEPYAELLQGTSEDDIDDPVLGNQMLYTSGTTGRPKGVWRSDPEGYMLLRAATGRRASYKPGEDVHLCTGPAYHAGPLVISVASAINHGVTLVMMEKFDPEETLRLIDKHRVTHSHMVATMFHRLLALPEEVKKKYDLSSLRYVVHGAAPTPVHVKQAIIDWWGPVLFEYYAATEGGGTYITSAEWLKKPGSVGKPTDVMRMEVRDEYGIALPAGSVGTIFIKSPDRSRFVYYNDADKTASAYSGEFFTLGDMGYFDEDGYLYLTGRSAEVIISGGVNIYPVEVDATLLQHPAVADVATVGVPNEEWGEEIKAVVLLKDGIEGSPGLEKELIQFTRDRMASYKCPRSVDFTKELPREDTGKIYRRLVRDGYWTNRDRQI